MNYCKVCGKKLELTPEYDMCMECQGKQHRTFTLPYNGGVNTNHTKMTAREALETLTKQLNLAINGSKVDVEIANESRNIIAKALEELEELKSKQTKIETIMNYGIDEVFAVIQGLKTKEITPEILRNHLKMYKVGYENGIKVSRFYIEQAFKNIKEVKSDE